jgi:ribonuclease HI
VYHLPLYLEKRLKELYPKTKDREDFIKELVKQALEAMDSASVERASGRSTHFAGGTIHVYTDGGSRGNPGQAAIGCVLLEPVSGTVLQEYSEAIGIETNNIAEYKALIRGLELAAQLNPNSVLCHLDSELVVKQVVGQYRVKMPHLIPLLEQVKVAAACIKDVSYVYIPRLKNAHADRLVNRALNALP